MVADEDPSTPELSETQKAQALERELPRAVVVHEVVRQEGEAEIRRTSLALAVSGLAAGLSIGFSFFAEAFLKGDLPTADWAKPIYGLGYSLGFLIVVLGRQQLFTETTLTALVPFLARPTGAVLVQTLRVWAVVLAANLAGTWVFGAISAIPGVFPETVQHAMGEIAHTLLSAEIWQTFMRAISSGWLIGLMVWLLPASGSARPFVIVALSYVVGFTELPHVIAGSVEASYAVATGAASVGDYLTRFLAPTLVGNVVGGAVLVALLNHAPLAADAAGEDADAEAAEGGV